MHFADLSTVVALADRYSKTKSFRDKVQNGISIALTVDGSNLTLPKARALAAVDAEMADIQAKLEDLGVDFEATEVSISEA